MKLSLSSLAMFLVVMPMVASGSRRQPELRRTTRDLDQDPDIVGGSDQTSVISYFVSLLGGCGGTLITGDIVLTAAHCVDDHILDGNDDACANDDDACGFPSYIQIGHTTQSNGIFVSVDRANSVVHPDWTGCVGVQPDVAILKLSSTVDTSIYTPIKLNSNCNKPSDGDILTVYGFGDTSDGGNPPDILQTLDFNYQSAGSTNCYICIFASSTQGSCQGDSGGPAVGTDGIQYGVASFVSFGGCAKGTPDGYSRVSTYYDWIQTQVCAKGSDTSGFSCTGRSWTTRAIAYMAILSEIFDY